MELENADPEVSSEPAIHPRYNKAVFAGLASDVVDADAADTYRRIALAGIIAGLRVAYDLPLQHPCSVQKHTGSAMHLREEVQRLLEKLEE